jgi:hypothetical protein
MFMDKERKKRVLSKVMNITKGKTHIRYKTRSKDRYQITIHTVNIIKNGVNSRTRITSPKERYSTVSTINVMYCRLGWFDIRIGTKTPLRFVTYLSKVTKINEKSVLTQ